MQKYTGLTFPLDTKKITKKDSKALKLVVYCSQDKIKDLTKRFLFFVPFPFPKQLKEKKVKLRTTQRHPIIATRCIFEEAVVTEDAFWNQFCFVSSTNPWIYRTQLPLKSPLHSTYGLATRA